MSASFKVSLEDDVTRNAKRASQSVKNLGRDMRNVKGTAQGSGTSFSWLSGALGAVKMAAIAAGVAIGAIGVKLAMSIGESAAFMEQNRLAFGLLMKGADAGGKALDEVRKIATDLNLPIQDTIASYRKLLAMQFKPALAQDIIKLGADMQALGATGEEVHSIIRAITQIKAKGRLQQEELTGQLAEAGVSAELVYKELAKTLGKTTDQVRQMITAGKVDADTALTAIQKAILTKLGTKAPGQAAEAFKSTLGGMWNGVKTQAENAIIDISDRLAPKIKEVFTGIELPEGLVQRIGDIGDKVLDVIGQLKDFQIPSGMGRVVDDLIARFDIVQVAIEQVKAVASGFLEGFGAAWESVGPVVDSAVEAILKLAGEKDSLDSIKSFFKIIGGAAAVGLGAMIVLLASATAFLADFTRSTTDAMDWIGEEWDVFTGWAEGLSDSLDSALDEVTETAGSIGEAIIDGIVEGITSGASEVVSAITSVASQAIEAAKEALEISSPSKVFEEMGRNIDRGLSGGVRAEQGLVAASTSKTVQAATQSAGGVVNHISARLSQGPRTYNVSGAASPEATAAAIRAIQLGDLATALEQLGASMGASAG